jgi:hypothetical protein
MKVNALIWFQRRVYSLLKYIIQWQIHSEGLAILQAVNLSCTGPQNVPSWNLSYTGSQLPLLVGMYLTYAGKAA